MSILPGDREQAFEQQYISAVLIHGCKDCDKSFPDFEFQLPYLLTSHYIHCSGLQLESKRVIVTKRFER